MSLNILKHEPDIWKTADLLLGAGIKQSDFPKFMMPFFALLMVESRLIREANRIEEEEGKENLEEFIEIFQLEGLGYNDYVIRKGITLKDICENDKTFDTDFDEYLKSFDPETKYLLGVEKGNEEEKFLDISGISGLLKKKRILFDSVEAWSKINLVPYSNSEITTLEEHIKRKWADISAETAGEQYTPDDIISLISELIATKIEDNGQFLTIYDATCGGGNLLFGVEDKIQEISSRPTATYGQELNDTLFALAKIESRFRKDTYIEHGNTITDTGKFFDKTFNLAVANPPYGVDWKGFSSDVYKDETGRFVALPSISDGQFLFTQHILSKLNPVDGFGIIVHNGSTLFSGDAGSGESNIRKYFFDNDWVEALIQMPQDEFFNTGIYTYLWVFNKNKPFERKDKIILIDGSNLWQQLKKSKGKKRREMTLENRTSIVNAFTDFKDCTFAKVFDKWHFYYNKQSIILTNVDQDGIAISMPKKTSKEGGMIEEKSIKIHPSKVTYINEGKKFEISEFEIFEYDHSLYKSLEDYFVTEIKNKVALIDYKESDLRVFSEKAEYRYCSDKETILEKSGNIVNQLGNGRVVIKAVFKKKTKTKDAFIQITVELMKDITKDSEIIAYSPDKIENKKLISDFLTKYVTRPYEYSDNAVGVEINFNKVFYIPEKFFPISKLKKDLNDLEKELKNLERNI
ncbi:N-6 DNA methylase [Chryseobacterium sp. CFS15]|uniref:HsdM family class I SAM-dependent methyltransferase n=1 Tax=Chryseobacterium sp. CFS15 TaxID=2986946 RepID=UPI002806A384|nr:N-6 DNA methylase [Chryseobacterium sp. CFS15]MDQ8141484.1 N-6 DNA methylase [Chryseobacterium sp. CFS15]